MEEVEKQEAERDSVDTDGEDEITNDDLLDGDDGQEADVGEQGEDKKQSEPKQQKKGQSREEDSKFARLRREKEKLEQENKRLKAEKDEAVFKGQSQSIPQEVLEEIGIKDLKTDRDLRIAKAYMEAEKSGDPNPTATAYRKVQDEDDANAKKAQETESKNAERRKAVETDMARFIDKYGKDAYNEAIKPDGEFATLFRGLISYGNLTELYDRYVKFKGGADGESKAKGIIPPLNGKTPAKEKSVRDMSKDEFDAYWAKKYGR